MIEEKILAFKVNMINTDVINQLKKLESDGYISQIKSVNSKINVGDYRFCIYEGHDMAPIVVEMQLTKITKKKNNHYTFHSGLVGTLSFVDSSFGKKIFLTKEEAEAVCNQLNKNYYDKSILFYKKREVHNMEDA